uniref:riboflavin kinase n=1 Tax=Amazona collaria TaxID=241587 RepID=A0A8B9G6J5_9PSIT
MLFKRHVVLLLPMFCFLLTLSKTFAANFSEQVVESFPSDISTGVYYGWACVGNGDVHKMVLSIGWNPFYKNIKKSVETHIIDTFKGDFYGEILSIVILGYIRSEKNFTSLGQYCISLKLIFTLGGAINNHIKVNKSKCQIPPLGWGNAGYAQKLWDKRLESSPQKEIWEFGLVAS